MGGALLRGGVGGAATGTVGEGYDMLPLPGSDGQFDLETVALDTVIGSATGGMGHRFTSGPAPSSTGPDAPLALPPGSGPPTAPVNVIPSSGTTFVATPRGTVYDIPPGWTGRTADNGHGIVYQRPGAQGNADMIRIMEPTPKYPDGYMRYYNDGGQPLDVNGKPGSKPATHIPETYRGPLPAWPT
jgi:hypothetical protein